MSVDVGCPSLTRPLLPGRLQAADVVRGHHADLPGDWVRVSWRRPMGLETGLRGWCKVASDQGCQYAPRTRPSPQSYCRPVSPWRSRRGHQPDAPSSQAGISRGHIFCISIPPGQSPARRPSWKFGHGTEQGPQWRQAVLLGSLFSSSGTSSRQTPTTLLQVLTSPYESWADQCPPSQRHLGSQNRASIPSGIAGLHWHTRGACPISLSTGADAVHPDLAQLPMQKIYPCSPSRAA